MDCRTFANSTGQSTPETEQASPGRDQRFWAWRCFLRELRRIILAFAARTASILACWIFGRGVFLSSPIVGAVAGSWFGAVELCSTGCTLIGPMDGDLLFAIRNNSLRR
jgi:hypothetical protein